MCGIFGFYLDRPLTAGDIERGRQGTDRLRYRGPDDSGYWCDEQSGIFLGHRRLAIIDVSCASRQPMQREETVLSYNGEIYNYIEVKKELTSLNSSFESSGDVEVLLRAWQQWGPACVERFDGMFAFAVYENRQLHLVTDFFGEKPLYWVQTREGLYFSSEPGPLVDLLSLKFDLTSEQVNWFLSLGFFPDSETGYAGLKRMCPAQQLTFDPTQGVRLKKYWDPGLSGDLGGPVAKLTERDLDEVCQLLVESLKVRLRADVPLGLFLSSGVDSSLIAALAAKELRSPLLALTVSFKDHGVLDESDNAVRIAQALGLEHKVVPSHEDPVGKSPEAIFDLFGEPNDNLTVAAAYQMSQAAASTLKVALCGLGGDEVFYGYNKYHQLYRLLQKPGLPATFRPWAEQWKLYDKVPRKYCFPMLLNSKADDWRFLTIKNTFAAPWLWGLEGMDVLARGMSERFPSRSDLMARHFDLTQTMPNTYIPGIERGSMRASLEVRTPYLNRKLYEKIASFDQRRMIAFGTKSVLRRILARYLPQDLCDIPKRGFKYPEQKFLDHYQDQPSLPQVDKDHLQAAWQRRHERGYDRIAVRMVILDHFLNEDKRAGFNGPGKDANERN